MALLRNIAVGDDEDAREFAADDEFEGDGPCPTCGHAHGGGYCLEDGDLFVCACGQMHEADYCPAAAGHGVVL